MWNIAERRGATTVALTTVQVALLQVIYDEFHAGTAWPTMYQVDRAFIRLKRRGAASAAAVMRDLPDGLLMRSGIRTDPAARDEVKLTISGVVRCAGGGAEDAEAFVRAVRWCARQEPTREPKVGETSVQVYWRQVRRAIPVELRPDPGSMDRLHLLLTAHHWGWAQAGRAPDGSEWTLHLGSEVRRFSKVQSVEDFVDARVSWWEEGNQPVPVTNTFFAPSEVAITGAAQPEEALTAGAYINPLALEQLRECAGTGWDTTKLVALAEELDACWRAGHVYAAHTVLRALLDHVPPLFGQKGFAAVASSHPWEKTDSNYLRRLSAFRDQADDALHRQISKRPDLLMLDNLPPAAAVNALLGGCAAQLQQP
ncbi:hypothetical protein [Micromonospora sp. NPDC048830]|uniref:hypothetical protein n=1 Tax=Micromonospora sp. NPDC048830 TaxID=3364257 RepID=UPI0037157C20